MDTPMLVFVASPTTYKFPWLRLGLWWDSQVVGEDKLASVLAPILVSRLYTNLSDGLGKLW